MSQQYSNEVMLAVLCGALALASWMFFTSPPERKQAVHTPVVIAPQRSSIPSMADIKVSLHAYETMHHSIESSKRYTRPLLGKEARGNGEEKR